MRKEAFFMVVLILLTSTACSEKKFPLLKNNATAALIGEINFNDIKWKLETVKLEEVIRTSVEGVTVRHFTLDMGEAGSTDGYLFAPAAKGIYPGIFYMHWLGGTYPVNSGMHYFLSEAAQMAAAGCICIVPQGFFPWSQAPSGDKEDLVRLQKQLQQMIGVSTLLLNQPDLDTKNIGFVGHDYGAMHGLALVASLPIFSRAVFMTPNDNYADWNRILKPIPGKAFTEYAQLLAPWDPVSIMSSLPDIPYLFQFSDTDQFVSKEAATALSERAPKNSEVLHYAQGHALGTEAKEDRMGFLKNK